MQVEMPSTKFWYGLSTQHQILFEVCGLWMGTILWFRVSGWVSGWKGRPLKVQVGPLEGRLDLRPHGCRDGNLIFCKVWVFSLGLNWL